MAEWVNIIEGVRRCTLVDGEKLMTLHIQLDKGVTLPIHQHPHEQVSYLLYGKLEFTINGEKWLVEPGGVAHMPGNVPHGVTALEDSMLVETFSPPREEFRPKAT